MNSGTANLALALEWFKQVLDSSLSQLCRKTQKLEVGPLSYLADDSWLPRFICQYQPTSEELAVVLLALVAHLEPDYLSKFIVEFLPNGGDFPEFGGVKGANHRGILPTGETAQFILAGDDIEKRIEVQRLFSSDHWFARDHILWLETVREGEPLMSGRIILDPEIIEQLTLGTTSAPRFSIEFPAELIQTEMNWDDLVLHPSTLHQIREIEHWIIHNDTILHAWGMKRRIKPGYRALFFGPSGTGKTLTATLLGKQTGKDVYRIDLSRIVSKYIGETEKNISRLLDKAENKNWILFFDEADALFSKRTDIRDAHDKYANQEVAYLLQRIESHNGLVILATNQRGNIDGAFIRRFQSIIHFPIPTSEERQLIWRKTIPPQLSIADDIDWHQVASKYELTGAGILNVAHFCAVEALADRSQTINSKRLETAIMREFIKEGKVV